MSLRTYMARAALRLVTSLPGRVYRFEGILLYIPRGVFNPVFSISTGLIARYMNPHGRVADVGCGSGVLSILAALREKVAEVYAYDVNPLSLASTRINSRLNGVEDKIRIVDREDLIEAAPFDYVLLNPPYLPLDAGDQFDIAWCGGRMLETFRELLQLSALIMKDRGLLLFTASSLTPRTLLDKAIKEAGLRTMSVAYAMTPIDRIVLYAGKKHKGQA